MALAWPYLFADYFFFIVVNSSDANHPHWSMLRTTDYNAKFGTYIKLCERPIMDKLMHTQTNT